MAFGGHTPLFRALYHVPVFNRFRNPACILGLLPFALSFLAAAGLDRLMPDGDKKAGKLNKKIIVNIARVLAVIAGLMAFAAAGDNFLRGMIQGIYGATRAKITGSAGLETALPELSGMIRQDVGWFISVAAGFVLLAYLAARGKIRSAAVIGLLFCALNFFDMWRIEAKFIQYRTIESVAPKCAAADYIKDSGGLYRGMDPEMQTWHANKNIYYGLEFFYGFHAILLDRMYDLIAAGVERNVSALRVFNIKYYIASSGLPFAAKWGLRKAVSGRPDLFEDPQAMPRVFMADRLRKFNNDNEILEYMKTTAFNPQEALVAGDVSLAQAAGKSGTSAEITLYTPGRIRVLASADRETMLVLSNMYYPRWKVLVDKKPERIYNVDYALDGVKLYPGSHEVEFYYDRSFIVACMALMLASFAVFGAVLYFEGRRRRSR